VPDQARAAGSQPVAARPPCRCRRPPRARTHRQRPAHTPAPGAARDRGDWMAERAQPRSRSASFRVWGPHTSSGAVRGNLR
jgi:hypothetical protein